MKKINFLLAMLIACVATASRAQSGNGKVGWSLGYYCGWDQGGFAPAKINWKAFTHISHFALTPNNDGTLNIGSNGLSDAFCKAAVAEAHKNGVKILICIGGAGVGDGFKYACSNANRGKFISALIAFMKKYGYDGIDTDWEENFDNTLFIAWHKELRDSLNTMSPVPLLTIAAEDWIAKPTGQVYMYVDMMNDMCYGTKASGLANDLKPLLDVGVPKEKLGGGMGIAPGGGMAIHNVGSATDFCNWIIKNGYGGVMQWSVTGGSAETAAFAAIAPFVPAAGTSGILAKNRPAGPGGGKATLTENGRTGVPELLYAVVPDRAVNGDVAAPIFFDARGHSH